jgi:hypothetical protein
MSGRSETSDPAADRHGLRRLLTAGSGRGRNSDAAEGTADFGE